MMNRTSGLARSLRISLIFVRAAPILRTTSTASANADFAAATSRPQLCFRRAATAVHSRRAASIAARASRVIASRARSAAARIAPHAGVAVSRARRAAPRLAPHAGGRGAEGGDGGGDAFADGAREPGEQAGDVAARGG